MSESNNPRKKRRTLSPQPSTSTDPAAKGQPRSISPTTTNLAAQTKSNRNVGEVVADDNDQELNEVLRMFEFDESVPVTFELDLTDSKSFKGGFWAQEKTFRFVAKDSTEDTPATVPQTLLEDKLDQVAKMFDTLIENSQEEYEPEDISRMFIDHPQLEKPIIVGPLRLGNMTTEQVNKQVEYVLSSAQGIPLDRNLSINLACVKRVAGEGKRDGFYRLDYERDRKIKRCIVQVPSPSPNDVNCLPRAILIGKKYLEAKNQAKNISCKKKVQTLLSRARYFSNTKAQNKMQQMIEALKKAVKLPLDQEGFLEDIPLYEEHLKMSICVLSGTLSDQIIYVGSEKYRDEMSRIYLYHWKPTDSNVWHFDLIQSMAAFMETAYYCYDCDVAYHNIQNHNCNKSCSICLSKKCELIQCEEMICEDCNRTCRSKQCYERHKKDKKRGSLCSQKYKCVRCDAILQTSKRPKHHHVCTETFCVNCKEWFTNDNEIRSHQCHMRATPAGTPVEKFIFYDFESTQEDGKHTPNMVIAQSFCEMCPEGNAVKDEICFYCGSRCSECDAWNNKTQQYEKYPCQGYGKTCGKREIVFRSDDVTKVFGDWLIHRQHRNCTVIAHNAKGYDNYFILNYLLSAKITPHIIFNGSKAAYMHVGKGINIRFLDSLMFLPMALAQLPKCFDLKELKKGYFPHFFNKPSNYGKIQQGLPPKEDYGYKTMTPKRQEAFDHWYSNHQDDLFDFEHEMEEYCRSDVDILRRACIKYRGLMMHVTNGVDPFTFVSAASVCMGVFRSRFLKEQWQVLRKKDVKLQDCAHDFDTCSCEWRDAEKQHGDADILEVHTLSSDEMKDNPIIKSRFLSSNIGLIPPTEYRSSDNYSLEAMGWLQQEEDIINENLKILGYPPIKVQTALSPEGEKKVNLPKYGMQTATTVKLDGFYVDPVTGCKVALEFYGCHWHGCVHCFPGWERRLKTKCQNQSLFHRYTNTMLREARLRDEGFIIKNKWACEFAKEFSSKKEQSLISPMNLRDAYFGGRTGPVKFYHKFDQEKGEIGKYVDFTSLYPWALKYGTFPVSHPISYRGTHVSQCKLPDGKWSKILKCTGEFSDLGTRHCPDKEKHTHHHLNFFGIAKVKISPPNQILHPVLPYRCASGKLIFTLCAHCAENNNQLTECECSDEKRDWIGTFTSIELEVALDMGYEIKEMIEILHWTKTSKNIFVDYVNTFLRIKQEASGLPEHVQSHQEIEQYIELYERHENIKLNEGNIKKSSALRSLAKLMLNSLYGKFGQRLNLRKSHMIDNVPDLCKIISAPDKTLVDFHILSDDVMHLETVNNEHFDEMDLKTNVIVSIFTTSWARLKLWGVMQKLGNRVFYTDTDSLIYLSSQNDSEQQEPPLGDFLGDLTDELCCKNVGCAEGDHKAGYHHITEFVSGGPKNYGYTLNNGDCVCKVRGFTLDSATGKHLNFHTLKHQVRRFIEKTNNSTRPADEIISITRNQITRNKKTFELFNKEITKRYGVVLDKSKNQGDFTSVPFGTRTERNHNATCEI